MISIAPFQDDQFAGVDRLWQACFPDDPPHNRAGTAIPEKLSFQPDLLLVASEQHEVIGTVMAGYDGHRGWLYSLAVAPEQRRRGIGSRLVRAAEAALASLGCSKINLQVRNTNAAVVAFYASLGYMVEPRTSMGKRLSG